MSLSDVGRFAGHFVLGIPFLMAGGAVFGSVSRQFSPTTRAITSVGIMTVGFLSARIAFNGLPVEGATQYIESWLGSGLLAAAFLRRYYQSPLRAKAAHDSDCEGSKTSADEQLAK